MGCRPVDALGSHLHGPIADPARWGALESPDAGEGCGAPFTGIAFRLLLDRIKTNVASRRLILIVSQVAPLGNRGRAKKPKAFLGILIVR